MSAFPGDCPFYGCPLLPQDVHYNTDRVKEALQVLREVPREGSDAEPSARAATELLESSGNPHAVTLTLIGYKGGSLQEQVNQDRAIVVNPFRIVSEEESSTSSSDSSSNSNSEDDDCDYSDDDNILVGVFDGHAPRGEIVSEFTKTELPQMLSNKLAKLLPRGNDSDSMDESKIDAETKRILIETFVELDKNAPAEESGGCTATLILKRNSKIYVANAGDSRSFLVAYRPSTKVAHVLYISREDKPNLPDEQARVEAAGGQVYIPARGTSRVVYHDPRTGAPSGLAMSRSIGDWAAGKLGVVSMHSRRLRSLIV